MKIKDLVFILIILGITFMNTSAQEWVYPVIKNYGGAHPLPNSEVQPDKNLEYKVLFDITKDEQKDNVNMGLFHIARFLNVYSTAGISPKKLDLAAVIHGPAVKIVLDNEHYKQKFNQENKNLELISELKKAGVEIFVCGQSLEEKKYEHNWVNPDIKIALSALSVLPTYQLKGYALMTY